MEEFAFPAKLCGPGERVHPIARLADEVADDVSVTPAFDHPQLAGLDQRGIARRARRFIENLLLDNRKRSIVGKCF